MKALTIRQPMAWAIATGYKAEENRTWATSHRGLLAIHAGKWDPAYARAVREVLVDKGVLASMDAQVTERRDLLVTGAVVAVVNLAGICSIGDSARCRCGAFAAIGQHHWRLRDVEPLADPVPAKGRLQLWDIDLPGYELADRERARGRVR
ncbi:ASCH domain-containing protein [Actinophytocola sediminis]